MQINNPIIVPPSWYDRNPTPGTLKYIGANITQHVFTERDTYTVAANKLAMVVGAHFFIFRSVLGDGSPVMIGLSYGAVDSQDDYSCYLRLDGNGDVGEYGSEFFLINYIVTATNTIDMYSISTDAVGTVSLVGHVDYILFDA